MPKRRVDVERRPASVTIPLPRHRFLIPFSGAMAVLTIAFVGVSVVARDAQPGDALWGLTRVLYSDHAQSIEAAVAVNTDLEAARAALREGKVSEAKDSLDRAEIQLPKVSADDGHVDLSKRHTQLLAELVTSTPGTTLGTTTKNPKPTKSTDPVETSDRPTSPMETSAANPPPPQPPEESEEPVLPPPPPPAENAAQAGLNIFQEVDSERSLLQRGQVAYNGRDSMRADEKQRVTARMSATTVDVVSTMPELGEVHTTWFNIGPLVQAVLYGQDFEITSTDERDDGKRQLASGAYAEWSWEVRPRFSGSLQLNLVLRAWTSLSKATAVSDPAPEYTVAKLPVAVEPIPDVASTRRPQAYLVVLFALLLAIVSTYVLTARRKGRIAAGRGKDHRGSTTFAVETERGGPVVQAGTIGTVVLHVDETRDCTPESDE